MNIIFIMSNILAFIFLMIYYMHIYQLNSYNKIEHKRWLKENAWPNFGRVFGIFISLVCIVCIGFFYPTVATVIAIILNIFTAIGNREKESKIPIKYTPRVKRMFVTSGIIYILYVFTITILFYKNYRPSYIPIFLFLIQIIANYCPNIISLSNIINVPIEKYINEGYINEAKQKINSMKNLTVIGVTGSYGKTTVKQYLGKLLARDFNVLITPYNYNTTLGVTITIREYLSPIHDVFICEMGAKGLGEIKEICDIVNPRYGIITSIGEQHLETFLSVDNIIKTKFELSDAIPDDIGVVFLNYDNEYIKNKNVKKDIISYAINNKKANYVPYDIKVSENGSTFMLDIDGESIRFETQILGTHNVLNIAGCIAVAKKLGVSNKTLVSRVKQLEQVEHRQQIIKKDFGIIIDDAYNSNPAGAKSALDTLSMFDMTKIVVTPGMVELGEKQYELNKNFGIQISDVADYIILVGKKQTMPIQDGIKEKNYNEKNLYIVDTIQEAINIAYTIKCDNKKAILLENDLPDNY